MLKKLIVITNNDQYGLLLILFLSLIFAAILEIIGIGFVPIFATAILDPTIIQGKLLNHINFKFIETLNPKTLVTWSGVVLVSIFLIKNIYVGFLFYFQGVLVRNIRKSLAVKMFKLYLDAPYKIHLEKNSSTILRNIDSDTSGSVTILLSYLVLIKEFLILFFIFSLLIFVDILVTGSVFLVLAVTAGIFFFFTRKTISKHSLILQKVRGLKIQDIHEALGAIKEVKVFNKQKMLQKKFSDKISIWEKSFLINYVLSCFPRLILETVVIISVVLIFFIFIFLGQELNTSIPLLSLFAVASARMLPCFTGISTSLTYIKTLTPSLNIIVSEIQKLESLQLSENLPSNENLYFSKEIDFSNINFEYNKNVKSAIVNLNLNIKYGSKIGIIGESGAGKSTFINLILGLIKPTSGKILVDGKNIWENIIGWQSQIGYVPQDVYLLDDTIKNNILFSSNSEEVNLDYLKNILATTRLDDLIKNNVNGIETYVGEKGTKLSGGQKQRIGIARALYRNAKVIIFDEATSSLDSENENKIIEEIFLISKSKTLILVTHKHQIVKKCDIIYFFENGKIIDQGSYEFLAKKYNFENLYS